MCLLHSIEKLERVQRHLKATCFISDDYHSREEGSVTGTLKLLELEMLQRMVGTVCADCFSIYVEELVQATEPFTQIT